MADVTHGPWDDDVATSVARSSRERNRHTDKRQEEGPPASDFRVVADGERYCLTLRNAAGDVHSELEIDYLRRERHELVGELRVRCHLPGARTVDGILSVADFNVSSLRSRKERAVFLAERSCVDDFDWRGAVEEFCQRVLAVDRAGQPSISLRMIPRLSSDQEFGVEGLPLLRQHPVFFFGDGGALKSYLGLYLAGHLAQRGVRVALFDWELSGADHRDRLEKLFGSEMPEVRYVRCERPLFYESDRLRRIVHDDGIEYGFFDSVGFASDGPPEAAEVAGRYFRAVRQLAIGSTHIAHVNRSENGDQRPFGSTFWHNGARATWFMQLSETRSDDHVSVALHNRKSNLGPLRTAVGFEFTFSPTFTRVNRINVADVDDLAIKLSLSQRMTHLLRRGPLTLAAIASELDAKVDSVEKAVKRNAKLFNRVPGPGDVQHVALVERRFSA